MKKYLYTIENEKGDALSIFSPCGNKRVAISIAKNFTPYNDLKANIVYVQKWVSFSENGQQWPDYGGEIIFKKVIRYSLNDFKKFDQFSIFQKTSDFKKLETKARRLFERTEEFNGLSFNNENCFISSSDIQGFYFPNANINAMIAFINGKAVLVDRQE